MENYMDFNGGGVGVAGDIQSKQKQNMENYMDFNGKNATGDCGEFNVSFKCWTNQAKIGFGVGVALMVAYSIYKKKSVPAVVGFGLLGGIGGLYVSSMIKK
jgi:hypothetical protein